MNFLLKVLRVVLTLVLFSQALLVASDGLIELLDRNGKFFYLLTEGLLNWVSVEEALDFLLAK